MIEKSCICPPGSRWASVPLLAELASNHFLFRDRCALVTAISIECGSTLHFGHIAYGRDPHVALGVATTQIFCKAAHAWVMSG